MRLPIGGCRFVDLDGLTRAGRACHGSVGWVVHGEAVQRLPGGFGGG